MSSATGIRVALFDLGGVVVELGGVQELGDLVGESSEEEIWRRWLSCPWVRRFERGQCTTDEFARGMVESWELPLAPDDFLARFQRWPRGLLPGAEALLESLHGRVHRACFSNTNAFHIDHQFEAFGIRTLFDEHFFSNQIGLVKPDREAYEHVVEALGCPAGHILFLDDNQINVDGAREVGLDAHRVRGVEEARRLLSERGIL
ncbi:MAG: HAD family phosphatase [Proteobacteria bacterium]|nr:HAD family phosphatase [Pseudomonadota bacterium]